LVKTQPYHKSKSLQIVGYSFMTFGHKIIL